MQDLRTREQKIILPDIFVKGEDMSPGVLFEQELEILKNKVAEMGVRAQISYEEPAVFRLIGDMQGVKVY